MQAYLSINPFQPQHIPRGKKEGRCDGTTECYLPKFKNGEATIKSLEIKQNFGRLFVDCVSNSFIFSAWFLCFIVRINLMWTKIHQLKASFIKCFCCQCNCLQIWNHDFQSCHITERQTDRQMGNGTISLLFTSQTTSRKSTKHILNVRGIRIYLTEVSKELEAMVPLPINTMLEKQDRT